MSAALVSVIIPVYNHSSAIGRCLRSIEAETYRPIEVIIVDDGSTDNIGSILEPARSRLEAAGLNTKVVHQSNRGAAGARNRGFREAAGEYVIFWDADTVGEPRMLERMVEALEKNPNASYAYCQFKIDWKIMLQGAVTAEELRDNNYIDVTSLALRNDLRHVQTARGVSSEEMVGPFDESLRRFQDWDLWLCLLEQNKTGVFVPEVLFTKITGKRKGISRWLPKFFYRWPWLKTVREYNDAKEIVLRKHSKKIADAGGQG